MTSKILGRLISVRNLRWVAIGVFALILLLVQALSDSAVVPFELSGSAFAESGGHSKKKSHSKKKKHKDKKGGHSAHDSHDEDGEDHAKDHKKSKKKKKKKKRKKKKARTTEQDSDVQVDLVVLMDSSGSMKRTDPLRLRDQGAKLLLRFLKAQDRVALVQFDTSAKVVNDLKYVTQDALPKLDKVIDGIRADGHYTDLRPPVEIASEILQKHGRKAARQAIVLLSDGTLDPPPSRGDPGELLEEFLSGEVASLRSRNVRLYTLSLSSEANKALLSRIASEAKSTHYFAPDANAIHMRFSDLFMDLKSPQVVPMKDGGFEIDSTILEATFYISHSGNGKAVTLRDPLQQHISAASHPSGVKWHSGKFFELVTVNSPMPGPWRVEGVVGADGYATLITDLALRVSWPQKKLDVGEPAVFSAWAEEKGELLDTPGIQDVMFYNVKAINLGNHSALTSKMSDHGHDGDLEAGDYTYSTQMSFSHPGDYRVFVSLTSPTFSREKRLELHVVGEAPVSHEPVEPVEAETVHEAPVEEPAQVEEPSSGVLEMSLMIVLLVGSVGGGFFASRSLVRDDASAAAAQEPYAPPEDMIAKLAELEKECSDSKREFNSEEKALFSSLSPVAAPEAPKSEEAKKPESEPNFDLSQETETKEEAEEPKLATEENKSEEEPILSDDNETDETETSPEPSEEVAQSQEDTKEDEESPSSEGDSEGGVQEPGQTDVDELFSKLEEAAMKKDDEDED